MVAFCGWRFQPLRNILLKFIMRIASGYFSASKWFDSTYGSCQPWLRTSCNPPGMITPPNQLVPEALPVYLVHFEFDPEMPELLNLPLCDSCGLQAALAARWSCQSQNVFESWVPQVSSPPRTLQASPAPKPILHRPAPKRPSSSFNAQVYCQADDAILCRPCDSRIHSANKLASRHIRVDLNRRPNGPLGSCPDHSGAEADMYCTDAWAVQFLGLLGVV